MTNLARGLADNRPTIDIRAIRAREAKDFIRARKATALAEQWLKDHKLYLDWSEFARLLDFCGKTLNVDSHLNKLYFRGRLQTVVNQLLTRYFAKGRTVRAS